jgi:uncharacterized protein YgbK (DUF1537 family)
LKLERIHKPGLLGTLPDPWPVDLRPQIREAIRTTRHKLVVLDDDPTGTQTIHGVPVLTEWSIGTLKAELANPFPAFFIVTNSRSFPLDAAQKMNREIGRHLVSAANEAACPFAVISRSDSTLRGHFPGEVEALAEGLAMPFDGWIISPFFLEGGRLTVGDVHYLEEGEWLIPVGDTEFARDPVFGYTHSNLRLWVEEKSQGRISHHQVMSITIEEVRQGGPLRVAERLMTCVRGGICIANALNYRDLEVLVKGLLDAEAHGKRFLYRSAASFVQVRAGISPRYLVSPSELNMPESGAGLIIIGSHVPRTTEQLHALLAVPGIAQAEVSVDRLVDEHGYGKEVARLVEFVERALKSAKDLVLYTSRKVLTAKDGRQSLSIGKAVSEGLTAILRSTSTRPRYLIAKGGITSSDMATKALGVKRAMVLGQILPGVPVWRLGPESRYPALPYIVFPGNVGAEGALADLVTTLKSA